MKAKYEQLGVLSGGSTPAELAARGRSAAKLLAIGHKAAESSRSNVNLQASPAGECPPGVTIARSLMSASAPRATELLHYGNRATDRYFATWIISMSSPLAAFTDEVIE